MDIHSGKSYPSNALSNFAPHGFVFRGFPVASMEGLLQSFKQRNPEVQQHIMTLVGAMAKKRGSKLNWQREQTLWWQGEAIKRDAKEYQDILDEAYNEMFAQNESARRALLATGNAMLEHSIGRRKQKETVLTTREFTTRLLRIRSELQTGTFEYKSAYLETQSPKEGGKPGKERY